MVYQMMCCGQQLKITKTYHCASYGKTKNARCEVCKKNYTVVEFVVKEVLVRGDGAKAWARRLQEMKLVQEDE